MNNRRCMLLLTFAIFTVEVAHAQIVFDHGTDSVNSNGRISGEASITDDSRFGSGALFLPAGSFNLVTVPSAGHGLDMYGAYTFMTWFKRVTPGARGLIVFGNCCSMKNGYTMNLDETYGVHFWGGSTDDNLNYNQFAVALLDIQDGEWHHAAVRITEDDSTMYFDGQLKSTGSNVNIPTEPSTVKVNDISYQVPNIGGRAITSNPDGSTATVIMDEVRVYGRALDQAAIVAAMNNTGPLPDRLYYTFDDDTEIEAEVPCEYCDSHVFRPVPVSGPWVAIDVPDSGFLLDIQNGILAGFYFGYDQAGDAQWYTFSGPLEADTPGLSRVDAQLLRYEGGGCINCDPAAATPHADVGSIKLRFTQKHHGTYSVNGGPERNFTFLNFGTAGTAYFSDDTPYLLPNLGGTEDGHSPWTVVVSRYSLDVPGAWPPRESAMAHMSSPVVSMDEQFGTRVTYASSEMVGDSPLLQIVCGHFTEEDEPNCMASLNIGGGSETFRLSLGDVGPFRFFGETVSGDTLEGFRVLYR
ncbi:MAG: LamG domain-containing protein [Xanthomonadales bacterium]|nr:LamG domain-containing protein [Xanthomonadales bacterium]